MTFDNPAMQSAFAKNRAEELGYDVWEHFVIPPFFGRLDLLTTRKPKVIVGGRGCGKTMLLRYLSHQTMFSPNRESIPRTDLETIGLYWRADTQFASAMIGRGLADDIWAGAFQHLVAVALGMEVLGSLASIAQSAICDVISPLLPSVDLSPLRAYDESLPSAPPQLRDYLEQRLWQFEAWVNDLLHNAQPRFLPGDKFIRSLIALIQRQLPVLKDTTFCVYIDEYENLSLYQQKLINTWLKHSQPPLVFNLAMKRNSFTTQETVGVESLSRIHDFREYDLEDYRDENEFPVFAAEILFLQIAIAHAGPVPIDPHLLRNPAELPTRRAPGYCQRVLTSAQQLLPDSSQKELAAGVFEDRALLSTLKRRVELALRRRKSALAADSFIRSELPEASVVVPALLFRAKPQPSEVLAELDRLQAGEDNRFSGATDWIHNNFIGCLLQLYEPHSRACPFYAGFSTFCHLAHGNLRHFLELCHKSMNRAFQDQSSSDHPIEKVKQAEAARQASAAFLGEVRSFGRQGNRLHTFVLRLGSLFRLSQQRPSQSEPEVTHFAIQRGAGVLRDDDEQFLGEAIKWSVLFEEEQTKKKTRADPEFVEYVLNPIYAPYFHISYRKRRRVDLTTDDLICLVRGNLEDANSLFRTFSKRWQVDLTEAALPLFELSPKETGSEDQDAEG